MHPLHSVSLWAIAMSLQVQSVSTSAPPRAPSTCLSGQRTAQGLSITTYSTVESQSGSQRHGKSPLLRPEGQDEMARFSERIASSDLDATGAQWNTLCWLRAWPAGHSCSGQLLLDGCMTSADATGVKASALPTPGKQGEKEFSLLLYIKRHIISLILLFGHRAYNICHLGLNRKSVNPYVRKYLFYHHREKCHNIWCLFYLMSSL